VAADLNSCTSHPEEMTSIFKDKGPFPYQLIKEGGWGVWPNIIKDIIKGEGVARRRLKNY